MPVTLRRLLRLLLVVSFAAGVVVIGGSRPASGQAGLGSERAAAQRLRAVVEAEGRRIESTGAGLRDAERRLGVFVARADRRWDQLAGAEDRLVRARLRLTRLQRREVTAKRTLSENLATAYKSGRPTFVTVVISARGFVDLLDRVEFLKRVSRRNATVLDVTRDARAAVARQSGELEALQVRYSALAKAAIADRDRADVVRSALLRRQEAQLRRRDGAAARLASVRARISRIERRRSDAVRRARLAASAATQAPQPSADSGAGSVGGGDGAVAKVVAAATRIASTPYVWGGGHGGASGGYDCSGSISYALAAAGLISSPLDSSGFMRWGEPGAGRHITVYAHAGHAFMAVDGRRFDTTALSGGGTRWTSSMRSTAGFVARHPPGL
jgi:cell wall-associated NlpC family hydrolase